MKLQKTVEWAVEAMVEEVFASRYFSAMNDDDEITKCLFKLLKDQSLKYYML